MAEPRGLPAASDPQRACLRRLRFGGPTVEGNRVTYRAEYVTHGFLGRQRFNISAGAQLEDERDLRDLVNDFRACFEVASLDPAFLEFDPEDERLLEPMEDEEGDREITVEIALVEPRLEESVQAVCGFYIDPDINVATTPHRYAPVNGDTVRVQMHVGRGQARLRVYSGSRATRRFDEATAVGDTEWLNSRVRIPRAHVRGLADGTSYYLRGGWRQL
jgi:hypothetical protein